MRKVWCHTTLTSSTCHPFLGCWLHHFVVEQLPLTSETTRTKTANARAHEWLATRMAPPPLCPSNSPPPSNQKTIASKLIAMASKLISFNSDGLHPSSDGNPYCRVEDLGILTLWHRLRKPARILPARDGRRSAAIRLRVAVTPNLKTREPTIYIYKYISHTAVCQSTVLQSTT